MCKKSMPDCPVCFDALEGQIVTRPPCGHEVCLRCLTSLRERRCPMCRADLSPLFPKVPLPMINIVQQRLPNDLSDEAFRALAQTQIMREEMIRLRSSRRVPPSPLVPNET